MSIKYRHFKTGLMYFIMMLFISILLLGLLFVTQYNAIKKSQINMMSSDLNAYSVHLDNEMAYVTSNLLLLEHIVSNRDVLEINDSVVSFTSDEDKAILAEDLLDWIRNERIYDQIRIIDLNGNEIIRVNNNNGEPLIVDESDLQNKSQRYYFQNSINLANDTIYFSRLDLNIENDEIEYVNGKPKEMLRIASTIFDENDQLLGVIVVNYLAENLFHDIETQASNDITFSVINEDGYFLHNANTEMEFGFMYDDKLNLTFENEFGFDIFESTGADVTEVDYENMIFASVLVNQSKIEQAISNFNQRDLDIYSDNGPILLFGFTKITETTAFQKLLNTFLIVFGVLVVIGFFISRLFDEISYNRKERLNLLEYTSNYDLLTELPNRLKITSMIEYLTSLEESYYIMFLDLDRFKFVNDQYGHLAGDKVLQAVGQRLETAVRKTDIVGRIGGDEFLILLRNLQDEAVVLRIKKVIEEAINKDFVLEEGIAQIGVSIGFSFQDGSKSVEEIISLADERMYQDKALKKSKY